jgi:hypothetical protein
LDILISQLREAVERSRQLGWICGEAGVATRLRALADELEARIALLAEHLLPPSETGPGGPPDPSR